MLYNRNDYVKYASDLLKKGINPSIVVIGDIIRLLTEDDDKLDYNFNTDNIVSGQGGELIKINKEKGTIEIYNSIIDNFFTLKVYDLETGKMFDDGELGKEVYDLESINLFGEEGYEYLLNYIDNDFSDCNRMISQDREEINIQMLELTNKLSKSKLKQNDIRGKIVKIAKKHCKNNNYLLETIGIIVNNIDNALDKHSDIKEFNSPVLSNETVDIINRKLYYLGLKEESEAYSKISIWPITEIIQEYRAYHTPKTDKIADHYLFVSKKINEVLSSFENYRVDIRGHLLSSNDIDRMSEKHSKLLLKRRDELDNSNTWGLHE